MVGEVKRRRLQYVTAALTARPGVVCFQETTSPPDCHFLQTQGCLLLRAAA